jgi:hypothetical protein
MFYRHAHRWFYACKLSHRDKNIAVVQMLEFYKKLCFIMSGRNVTEFWTKNTVAKFHSLGENKMQGVKMSCHAVTNCPNFF